MVKIQMKFAARTKSGLLRNSFKNIIARLEDSKQECIEQDGDQGNVFSGEEIVEENDLDIDGKNGSAWKCKRYKVFMLAPCKI